MKVEYYELKKTEIHRNRNGLFTAAFMHCSLCNSIIDTMGGPGYGYLCIPCGDMLKAGKLAGEVERNDG